MVSSESVVKQLLDRFEAVSSASSVFADETKEDSNFSNSENNSGSNFEGESLREDLKKLGPKKFINEFDRLVANEDVSNQINRIGQMLIKYGDEELASVFLVNSLELIRSQRLKPSVVDELISTVGSAPRSSLSKVFDRIQVFIETRGDEDTWFRCLEILPIILPILDRPTVDPEDFDDENDTGDYRSLIKDILISVDYKKPICIPVLSIVGEMNLPPQDVCQILTKALEMSSNLGENDLPSFCYYSLLASRRSGSSLGCSSVFCQLLTTMSHFEEQNRGQVKTKPIIGTVLLHLTLAVRQDSTLLKEVLRLSKSPPLRILHSVFFASFLFALSAQPSYSDSVYPSMRNQILRHFKFTDRCSHALWLSKLGDAVGGVMPVTDVFLEAAKQSYSDNVAESAVQFSFYLLDALTGGMMMSAMATNSCRLAVSLIATCFQSSQIAQESILSLLFERLLSCGSASSLRGQFLLDIVRQLVMKGPHFLMSHSAKLRQLIDYLPSFPLATAEDLIKILILLLKVNVSLRDALLLLLRKLLFSRKIEHRLLAAKGYIQFLLNFKVVGGMASTQSQMSFSASQFQRVVDTGRQLGDRVASSSSRTSNDALCLEILGILKRCLEQQAEVRRVIYQSLPEVLHKNSQLVDPVLHLLSNHLKEFTAMPDDGNSTSRIRDEDEDENEASTSRIGPREHDCPFLFSKCVKNNQILEPIADLVFCINRCLAESERLPEEDVPELCEQFKDKLSALLDRLLDTDMLELLPDKAEPEKDMPRCHLVISTYAALLEVAYSDHHASRTDMNLTGVQLMSQAPSPRAKRALRVFSVLSKMNRVHDALPASGGILAGKKTGKASKPGGAAAAKKDGGKKPGGSGSNTRLHNLMATLSKLGSPTLFCDLGFVEFFIRETLKSVNGDGGVERLTRTERDHDLLPFSLCFLMRSAVKCSFKDNGRLAEKAYSLARMSLQVFCGEYERLPEGEIGLFRGACLDYLQSVISQVADLSVKQAQLESANLTKHVISIRDLLKEMDTENDSGDENQLRILFVEKCFHLVSELVLPESAVNQSLVSASAARDAIVGKGVGILLSIIKTLCRSVEFDGEGDEDESGNLSEPALKADEEIKNLCREAEISKREACKCIFDFMMESAYRSDRKYKSLLQEVAEDISKKLKSLTAEQDDEESMELEGPGAFACIKPENATSCTIGPVLHRIDVEITDANFALELTRIWLMVTDDNPDAPLNPAVPGQKVPKIRDIYWKTVFEHQYSVVQALKNVCEAEPNAPQILLTALKTLTKLYDSLWRSTRMVQSALSMFGKDKQTGWLPYGFERLVQATGADFQSAVYNVMHHYQKIHEEAIKKKIRSARKKKEAKRKKRREEMEEDEMDDDEEEEEEGPRSVTPAKGLTGSAAEARLLPALIYAIEQYEQMVLRLSKRKGLHGLGSNMKRSTARDFRIRTDLIGNKVTVEENRKSPTRSQQKQAGTRQREEAEESNRPPSRRRPLEETEDGDQTAEDASYVEDNSEAVSEQDSFDRLKMRAPPTTGKRRRLLVASQEC